MAIAWIEIRRRLDHMFDDALVFSESDEADRQTYDEQLRVIAWNWAQSIFTWHTPREVRTNVKTEEGGREIILPEDYFDVHLIHDSTKDQFWFPLYLKPGYLMANDESALEYWKWGDRLYLQEDASGRDLVLYYWGKYPAVHHEASSADKTAADNIGTEDEPVWSLTYDQPNVYTPQWAELALCHLTAASCLVPSAIEASDINNWRMQIDAGNPEQNPRIRQYWMHVQMYNDLVAKFPPAYRRYDT